MNFPILYKKTTKDQTQQWQIVVKDNYFYTIEGITGGKLTTSMPTYCEGKNIGKKNETSPEEQALAEATAKHQKKLDGNYNEVLTNQKKFFEPMLAHKYEDHKKLLFTVPTFVQPKLDGLRAISANNELTSRNGKKYIATPHLYHSTSAILDGELYSHEYKEDFNKIVSLCKKTKPTKEDIQESSSKVEYWIYDLPSVNEVFSKRQAALTELLKEMNNPKYILVPTYEIKNQSELDSYHEKFLNEGFEGSIIRLDLKTYENKRSKQLLKMKNWIDDEFEIVDVVEGEGGRAGTVGNFVVKLNDGTTCKSNIKGTHEYLAELLDQKDQLIGKTATIKYFNKTPDGKLRFPYVIKIAREDFE